MPITWLDRSPYSREQGKRQGEVEPSIWSFETPMLRITVHRWLSIEDTWFVSTAGGVSAFKDRTLKSKNINDEKAEAIECVRQYLKAALEVLEEEND